MIEATDNRIPVTIYQHYRERTHPLGTVRLLEKGLLNYRLNIIKENQVVDGLEQENTWLLFPEDSHSLPGLMSYTTHTNLVSNLVVVDGTWRKARKIIHQSPWLRSLPRISLPEGGVSLNDLRKTSVNSGLSTAEAVVEALEILEGNEGQYRSIISALIQMVHTQRQYIPGTARGNQYSGKIGSDNSSNSN